MKLPITHILAALLLSLAASAQVPADSLSRLVAQNTKEIEQLAAQRKAALKLQADHYLAALDAVAPVVARGGSALLAAAIERERAAALNAADLPAKPGADIPALVLSARREYVSAARRVMPQFTTHSQAQREQYLRQLAAIESQARSQKDEALLARVAEEKQRAANQPGTLGAEPVMGFGKNLLRNGDFAPPSNAAGSTAGWETSEGAATILTENANTFLHMEGKSVSQLVLLPAEVKSIRMEGGLRLADFKELPLPGQHYAGIRLLFQDARGAHIKHEHAGEITKSQRAWKTVTETIKVPTGTARVQVVLFREGIDGALDADSLSLEAMNR